MQIYNYDVDGVYAGIHTLDDSDRDPLNPDDFLVPAGCTVIAPPELIKNQVALWTGSDWRIEADYRGTKYWLHSTEHVMTDLGDLPTGASFEKPPSVIAQELSSAKFHALKKIEASADEYQRRFLGVNSADRQARFAQNLSAAQRVLADNYNPSDDSQQQLKQADIFAMQLQADAQNAKPDAQTQMTANDFAKWVVEWLPKSVIISAYIDFFLVTSRVDLDALNNLNEIEPFLAKIAAKAEAKFTELTN